MNYMTLEEFTSQLNSTTFWKEFTFSKTRFFPRPKQQVELADGIVKIGSLALVFQLKERVEETQDLEAERRWFQRKVVRKATDQIKDSLRYLSENEEIHLSNDRGHEIIVSGSDLQDVKKIVIFLAGRKLPEDCWETKFYHSKTAGFIHIIAGNDYLGILEKLRVPDDVRHYLDYREKVLPRLRAACVVVEEADVLAGFLSESDLPSPGCMKDLALFVQDIDAFDISNIMRNLQNHIVFSGDPTSYYRIMEEFARVPRSVWREFKTRLVISLEASKKCEPCRPFRFAFPKGTSKNLAISPPSDRIVGVGGMIGVF